MRWAVRIIACYPEVQNKVRVELDDVCGRGVEITWDKRKQLPYTMAVMKSVHTFALLNIKSSPFPLTHLAFVHREIQRFADIAPTGLIHKTLADTQLAGEN